ncbi:hypothetical protein A2U01_0037384, partial [Trifolium medium]|nr:hypothetical protein [Trifolium medium]
VLSAQVARCYASLFRPYSVQHGIPAAAGLLL